MSATDKCLTLLRQIFARVIDGLLNFAAEATAKKEKSSRIFIIFTHAKALIGEQNKKRLALRDLRDARGSLSPQINFGPLFWTFFIVPKLNCVFETV